MAVAGLRNVTGLDASFHGESRSLESGQWNAQSRPSTRASSLLQMWRELEGEHVVNHSNSRLRVKIQRQRSDRSNSDSVSTFLSDGSDSGNGNETLETNDVQNANEQHLPHPVGLANEHDDSNSVNSEQSADLGEVERERVRQIFREWMNNRPESLASHNSHINHHSRAPWLGENERERVRIIMDWVQVNCEQRGNCDSPTDEGASEINPQIKLVRDGLLVNPAEVPERKAIRKLCGRQTLLDLLALAQRERKRELQELLDHRSVSNFTHRNRIQSLLKGRFLRNDRMIQDERLKSRGTCELGLLRQRHTVSDLREGFLSRSGNSVVGSSTSSESGDASCNGDHDNPGPNQLDGAQDVMENVYDLFEPSDEERDGNDFPEAGNSEFNATGNISGHPSIVQALERPVQLPREDDQELVSVGDGDYICMGGQLIDSDTDALVQEPLVGEISIPRPLVDAPELSCDETSSEVSSVDQAYIPVEDFEVNAVQDMDGHEVSAEVEEVQEVSALGHEEWQQLTHAESNEWADGDEGGHARNWQESIANQWNHEIPDNNYRQHNIVHEPHEEWHENGLQEAIDSWLDSPSGQEVHSMGRVDSFYFPEDDNVYSVELRELLSRRRVSSLLRSGFRASLDQLIQSYVERQGNTSVDWDPDGTSSPAFHEQQNIDQVQDSDRFLNVDGVLPIDDSSQSLWDQDLHQLNWSQNSSHHQLGMQEWDVINELRMDMVMLQQRMNSMQRMLEACMDMQLELQRTVRQEVSAALNRSIVSIGECKDDPPKDESNWEYVRKGICCMCFEQNIDSLLYRCGHMCTCSRCAENLVHRKDKCPMCRAPVVEMVRAYSIQ